MVEMVEFGRRGADWPCAESAPEGRPSAWDGAASGRTSQRGAGRRFLSWPQYASKPIGARPESPSREELARRSWGKDRKGSPERGRRRQGKSAGRSLRNRGAAPALSMRLALSIRADRPSAGAGARFPRRYADRACGRRCRGGPGQSSPKCRTRPPLPCWSSPAPPCGSLRARAA